MVWYGAGVALDWYMTLHLSSPGPASVVPSGWYLARDSSTPHTLEAGLAFNELDGWDPAKLGWVKLGRGGGLVSRGLDQLAAHFLPRVENCGRGDTSGHFTRCCTQDINRSLKSVFPPEIGEFFPQR